MDQYNVAFLKVPSALITYEEPVSPGSLPQSSALLHRDVQLGRDRPLLRRARQTGASIAILHCTSTYHCGVEELNLNMIRTLWERFEVPIGYSGHEAGLATTPAAVALGATIVERHITLDRSMEGSDQATSVEPQGMERLVRDIRGIEIALGDGVKQVYESEKPIRDRLRRV